MSCSMTASKQALACSVLTSTYKQPNPLAPKMRCSFSGVRLDTARDGSVAAMLKECC